MDSARCIADANGFELLLVEEPAQPVLAVKNRAVGTGPVGSSREEVPAHGRGFHVHCCEESAGVLRGHNVSVHSTLGGPVV
eukprot:7052329-Heterocapsa_arctica.AAC.1